MEFQKLLYMDKKDILIFSHFGHEESEIVA